MLFTLFTPGVSAQVTTVRTGKAAEEAIDHAKYRITYLMRQAVVSKVFGGADEMYLDVGDTVTVLYSHSMELMEQAMLEQWKTTGEIDINSLKHKGSVDWTFFTNYPEGKTTFLKSDASHDYKVIESIQQPDWQLVGDSVKTLLGYICHLATCHTGGRDWRAWYTEDIPLNCGPYKLHGLPGLILQASDSANRYTFECTGMQELKEDVPITEHGFSKAEPVSWKQLFMVLEIPFNVNTIADDAKVTVKDQNGNDITDDYKDKLKKTSKNKVNLIEGKEE